MLKRQICYFQNFQENKKIYVFSLFACRGEYKCFLLSLDENMTLICAIDRYQEVEGFYINHKKSRDTDVKSSDPMHFLIVCML